MPALRDPAGRGALPLLSVVRRRPARARSSSTSWRTVLAAADGTRGLRVSRYLTHPGHVRFSIWKLLSRWRPPFRWTSTRPGGWRHFWHVRAGSGRAFPGVSATTRGACSTRSAERGYRAAQEGARFLEERRDALLPVARSDAAAKASSSRRRSLVAGRHEEPLQLADRIGLCAAIGAATARCPLEVVDDELDEPPPLGRRRVDPLARHRQPRGPARADQPRGALGAAAAGYQAELTSGSRACAPLGEAEVAGERDLEPAAEAVAVDRSDDGTGPLDQVGDRLDAAGRRVVAAAGSPSDRRRPRTPARPFRELRRRASGAEPARGRAQRPPRPPR